MLRSVNEYAPSCIETLGIHAMAVVVVASKGDIVLSRSSPMRMALAVANRWRTGYIAAQLNAIGRKSNRKDALTD